MERLLDIPTIGIVFARFPFFLLLVSRMICLVRAPLRQISSRARGYASRLSSPPPFPEQVYRLKTKSVSFLFWGLRFEWETFSSLSGIGQQDVWSVLSPFLSFSELFDDVVRVLDFFSLYIARCDFMCFFFFSPSIWRPEGPPIFLQSFQRKKHASPPLLLGNSTLWLNVLCVFLPSFFSDPRPAGGGLFFCESRAGVSPFSFFSCCRHDELQTKCCPRTDFPFFFPSLPSSA